MRIEASKRKYNKLIRLELQIKIVGDTFMVFSTKVTSELKEGDMSSHVSNMYDQLKSTDLSALMFKGKYHAIRFKLKTIKAQTIKTELFE